MKKILIGLLSGLLFTNAFAMSVLKQETDSSGYVTYTIQCDTGKIVYVTSVSSGTYGSNGSGGTKVFHSLSKAASYACGG